jgi:hypothetical protein
MDGPHAGRRQHSRNFSARAGRYSELGGHALKETNTVDLRIAPSNALRGATRLQPPTTDQVQVTTYQQDPFVDKLQISTIDKAKVGSLKNDRVEIKDRRPEATPDADGNFLMAEGSDGATQVNTHVVTTRTLDMWRNYRGAEVNWSFGDKILDVVPHKKEGMNAYYSRWEGSTNYFFQPSAPLNTVVKTGNSLDVVAHETGHALLDGMKPGFLATFDRETGAFHEAFGDCLAMLATLQDPVQNQRIIDQTGGDLRKQNNLAHLAEEFGKHRRLSNDDPSDDDRTWLRNSLNSFTYVPPESLGDGRGDDETLGGEIHSFARLFAGAFYDCIEAAYKQGVDEKMLPPAQALKYAADTMGPLLAKAVDTACATRGHFKDMGLGLINADQEAGGTLAAAFQKVFLDRKIITPEDLASERERKANLPQLTVDRNFGSPQEAAAFVAARAEQLGLPPGVELETVSMSLNERGEQTLNMLYTQNCCIDGVPGLENLTTDIAAGVTLAFNAQGRLSEFRHDAITPEAIAEEMDGIRHLQAKGEVIEGGLLRNDEIATTESGKPYQAVIRGDKLVRVPASACDCGACHNH